MANVTISIDEETLRRGHLRAAQLGTSLIALVRQYLERLAAEDPAAAAGRRFVERSKRARSSSGGAGRWRRDDVYGM